MRGKAKAKAQQALPPWALAGRLPHASLTGVLGLGPLHAQQVQDLHRQVRELAVLDELAPTQEASVMACHALVGAGHGFAPVATGVRLSDALLC